MFPPLFSKTPSNVVLQQEFLERSFNSLLSGSKTLTNLQFKEEEISLLESLEQNRNKEMKTFMQVFCEVMSLIKTLKGDICNEESIHQNDLSYFEDCLRNIEETLTALKHQINEKTSTLQEEEEQFQTVISSLSQRINPSDPDVKTSAVVPVHVSSQVTNNSAFDTMHPDIQEFQVFLHKSGGHTGGWTNKDHLLFCKLLQKRKECTDFVAAVQEQMPDKSDEEVNAHEAWYHRYLILKQAHRQALAEWKKNRQFRNSDKMEEERPASQGDLSHIMVDTNRSRDVKARIAEWKKQQDEKRKEELEKISKQKKMEEEKWKKKMAYFERQKALLLERKKEKQKADLSIAVKDLPKSKQIQELELLEKKLASSHLTLKDFRDFDENFIRRRLSRLERHRERHRRDSIELELCRSSSVSSSVKRDPVRLLQPTAIWRMRLNRSQSEETDGERQRTVQYSIYNIPHLGIPEWRKGIA